MIQAFADKSVGSFALVDQYVASRPTDRWLHRNRNLREKWRFLFVTKCTWLGFVHRRFAIQLERGAHPDLSPLALFELKGQYRCLVVER